MRYEIKPTSRFKKDVKLAIKQNKNLDEMYDIIDKLSKGEKLDKKHKDHSLEGKYKGCRECHISPDWLLVYEYVEDVLVLVLNRVGSHSDLFK